MEPKNNDTVNITNGYTPNYYPVQYPYYQYPNQQPIIIPQMINYPVSQSNLLLQLELQTKEISYLKNSLEEMKKEFEKLKSIYEVALKDITISNEFIDNTLEKFKVQDEINEDFETDFANINKKFNNVHRKINKIKQKENNNDDETEKVVDKYKFRDKNKEQKNKNEKIKNINNRELQREFKNNTIQSMKSPQPFNNLLSHIFETVMNDMTEKPNKHNELIDSDDEYNMDEDVYASNDKDDLDKDVNIIKIEINSIRDLIELGKKYKIVNTTKKHTTETAKDLKNKEIIMINSTSPFGTSPYSSIPIFFPLTTKINREKQTTETEDNDNDIYTMYIRNKISPNQSKEKHNTENIVNKDIIKYYTYGDKKYNIDIEKIVNLIEPLTKLENTIGMSDIKLQILDMVLYYIQGFEKTTSDMLHTSIEGPPGVGKSKLGRILAHIYHGLGVIPSKRFKRVRRTDLIGKYVGHTAHKTQEVIDDAEGGILFIDEAYSLGSGSEERDSFSKECIDTINMNLTEKKKNLIVIVAGYTDQLDKAFFSMNEGLRRRFPFRFTIKGYDANELTQIFYTKIKKIGWKLDTEVSQEYLENFFKINKEQIKNFGGDIETILLNCKMTHAKRIISEPYYNKKILSKDDFIKAFEKFKLNKVQKEELNDSIKHLYM